MKFQKMTNKVIIRIDNGATCRLYNCVGTEKTSNILRLSGIQGLIEVGKYVVGNGYYSNKIVGIKLHGRNVRKVNYKVLKDRDSKQYPFLKSNVDIILENPHPKDAEWTFIDITGISDDRTRPNEFRISKSN